MDVATRKAEPATRFQDEAYAIVVDALGRLLRAPPHALDPAIQAVLETIAGATGADRSYLFLCHGDRWSNTHEWCAPGISAMKDVLQDLPLEDLVNDPEAIRAGASMEVADTSALPVSRLRDLLWHQDIQSVAIVPLLSGDRLTGFVGIDRVRAMARFTQQDLWLLRSLSDGLMASLARRQAEQALEQLSIEKSETLDRLRATLTAMPELVLEIDEEGRCVDFHSNHPELLSVSPDQILGRRLEETLPPDIARLQREAMCKARAKGLAQPPVYALGEGDERRWYKLTVARRVGTRGSMGYVFRIRDVTQDRAREDENALLSEITRRTTNLVMVLDAEQRIRWVNPAFETRTGWSLEEVRGKHPSDYADPASDRGTLARMRRALDTRSGCRAEVFKHDRAGNPYWVDVEIQPFTRQSGEFEGFLVIETDITTHKRQEDALERLAIEAEKARRRLRDAIESLPDGFAFFDAEDRLVICNEKYRQMFGDHGISIQPGAQYRDILHAVAHGGLIQDAVGREESWIAAQMAEHLGPPSVREIRVGHGRWLRIYERGTPDGGRVGLRVDISALKHTEQRLNDIIDGANAGTWEFDLLLNETEISGSWADLLGWHDGDTSGKLDRDRWATLVHPQDNEALRAAFGDIRAGRTEHLEREIRLRARDGHWIHVLTRGRVTRYDTDGTPVRVSGVGFDVTQRRRAEDRLSSILEASAVGTWQVEIDTGLTTIDEQYAAILGHPLAALLPFTNDRFEALTHPDDLQRLHRNAETLRDGQRDRMRNEFRMRHRDGRWVWMLSQAHVQSWHHDGTPAEVSGVHIDITEAKEREAALADAREATERALAAHRAAEQRFSDIAEVSSDWFWELDAQLKIRFVTPGFQRTTGIPAGAIIGHGLVTLLRGADPKTDGAATDGDWRALERSLDAHESFSDFVFPLHGKDEHAPLWLRLSGAPFTDSAGRFAGYRGVGSDVSALVAATERAEAANSAKSRFLANMSHELRTPLTGVLGMAELLGDALKEPHQREMVETIRESGEGLLAILNDILDLAKIEAGKLEIARTAFEPAALLHRVATLFTPRAKAAGLTLDVETDAACHKSWLGDAARIQQVLNNLVGNAVKFTQSGGVTLSARIDAGTPARLNLTITDTGIGMTPDQAERVFQEFEQAESSTARRFGGTGLGLAITRHLTLLMGGDIALASEPGTGTRVSVSLPLTPSTAPSARSGARAAERDPLDGLRVLIADDNATNRQILGTMLRGLGLIVTIAVDGHDACRLYAPGAFDLLLLDISMPGLDGISALQRIRRTECAAGADPAPALAVTANAMQHQVAEYIAAGFAGHVAKPFRKRTLAEAIVRLGTARV
jgi:PAS domain S-box-containing protein